MRKGRRCADGNAIIGSWNLEGMTDIKLYEVCRYMKSNSIDVMCIQEVRRLHSDTFKSDAGYLVYSSGSIACKREWTGVGFIVSPKVQKHVIGFRPLTNRVAVLKLRVMGGCMAMVSAYAPHNLRPISEQISFYDDLDKALQGVGTNGPT